jgi:hypothetical protein
MSTAAASAAASIKRVVHSTAASTSRDNKNIN